MAKTSFVQKIILVLFACGVTLLLLEGGLRIGGWIFLSLQERSNLQKVVSRFSTGEEYRILCLGESTTALGGENAYPRQLEKILNSRQQKIKFKVINKGVPATTTDQIVPRVEEYLKQYQPHLVVAMMGINDPQDFKKRTWREQLSHYSKAFKLFDMISAHWSAKKNETRPDFIEKQIAKFDHQTKLNPSSKVVVELAKANLYRSANRPEQEKSAILKVLSMDAQNSQAWHLMGIYYERHAEYQKALEALQKAYDFGSGAVKLSALDCMAQSYKFLNQYEKAEKIYRDILAQWPRHPEANGTLADILLEEEKYGEAIGYFLKQLAIDPQAADVYDKLAHCYRKMGQEQKAAEILAHHYDDERLRNKKMMQQQDEAYNLKTKENYLQLAKMVGQHHVPLLAVQYPHRPLAPLAEMLASTSGIVLVDNQKIFEDALKKYQYDDLFSDRFAGDFGHGTAKGNALLAGHVADMILNKVVK